ncbi:universal stress protein [Pseudaminobacter salicylatoxidans]|uniref:universal stress protein n=1 Tax=Pseudaminobacter salicylatoxidans TaxID=93369 RepID=UPI0002F2B2DD|nr:universal stress protein [Pseudaminobacter salicylatoxidans]
MFRNPFLRRPSRNVSQETPKVLIASEGRRFSEDAIQTAARLARGDGGSVRVLTVARLWGTSFGLPNPGLRPSKREVAEQEDNVGWAISRLEALDVEADGHIVVTRTPPEAFFGRPRVKGVRRLSWAPTPDEAGSWPR